jgi:hypothetical protein
MAHLHHSRHRSTAWDATYTEAEANGPHDHAACQVWRRERMAGDVATVLKVTSPGRDSDGE